MMNGFDHLESLAKEYDRIIANQKREHRKDMIQGGMFMVGIIALIGLGIFLGSYFELWGVTP